MDIATHAMIGVIFAAPVLPTAPLTGGCIMLGSVLPDLDALSRLLGKRAFLRCHQTYTHGLPAILAAGALAWVLIPRHFAEPWAPLALVAALLLHVGLDLTNTYGTALLSPLSSRRFCTEWVFFIDAPVIAASVIAIVLQQRAWGGQAQGFVAAGYAALLAVYWLARRQLRSRARRSAPPNTLSLVPGSLVPWRYYGCADQADSMLVFRVNALSGRVDRRRRVPGRFTRSGRKPGALVGPLSHASDSAAVLRCQPPRTVAALH